MRKKNFLIALCLPVLVSICTVKVNAQSLSSEDIKAQLVKEWTRAKAYTIDYLNTMPPGKYDFKAVDSIRSFAQQMLHLAGGQVFIMSGIADAKPPFMRQDLEKSPGAQSKDSVMYFINASYDYCISTVKNSDVTKWGEKKQIFGTEENRFTYMLKAFEHQTHHRGQCTIYIRLLGIRPPNERLF
jgi:DinB family